MLQDMPLLDIQWLQINKRWAKIKGSGWLAGWWYIIVLPSSLAPSRCCCLLAPAFLAFLLATDASCSNAECTHACKLRAFFFYLPSARLSASCCADDCCSAGTILRNDDESYQGLWPNFSLTCRLLVAASDGGLTAVQLLDSDSGWKARKRGLEYLLTRAPRRSENSTLDPLFFSQTRYRYYKL